MDTLSIIRHAIAAERDDDLYPDDADRPLTDEGREQARALAAALHERDIHFDVVVCSPFARAKQTADELLQHLPGPMPELLVCDALTPDGRPRRLFKYLRNLDFSRFAVIGHEPNLSALVGRLIGSRRAQVKLAKGAFVQMDVDGPVAKGCATLRGLIAPEWYAAREPATV